MPKNHRALQRCAGGRLRLHLRLVQRTDLPGNEGPEGGPDRSEVHTVGGGGQKWHRHVLTARGGRMDRGRYGTRVLQWATSGPACSSVYSPSDYANVIGRIPSFHQMHPDAGHWCWGIG